MKLLWTSDIHLNFLTNPVPFYAKINSIECDCIVISGDIGESDSIAKYVSDIEQATGRPVYFVLGNHDFYGSSIKETKRAVKHLKWLPKNDGIPLSETTILIGADCWGDCRNGDFENSHLTMSDWLHIEELNKAYLKGMGSLKKTLQKLADKDAKDIGKKAVKAIEKGFTNIIIVSHVPPFEGASMFAGRKSTPSGLPFFSSKISGDILRPIAEQHPDVKFTWLCGHTHSKVCLNVGKNIVVKVAPSEYYYPQVAEVIEYE